MVIAIALPSLVSVHGQDANDYNVRIPPFMSIRALRPDQTQTHPETAGDITFTNSLWLARTASSSGSTVTFAIDHSFINQLNNSFRRDVRLRTPRMFVTRNSGWGFDTFQDQSNYVNGDEIAQVQVSSTGPGAALVFLEVTFITADLATLHDGDYQLTVIGTISEN